MQSLLNSLLSALLLISTHIADSRARCSARHTSAPPRLVANRKQEAGSLIFLNS